MKIVFLNPEQYFDFENEPSNSELRLPILNCGLDITHKDIIYQRILRKYDMEMMNNQVLDEVLSFNPDILIYSTSWPNESISPYVLQTVMKHGIPVLTHVWDTHINTQPHEMEWLKNCNYFAVADSFTNYKHFKTLIKSCPYLDDVIFTSGNIVFTDILNKMDVEKKYDVSIIGSAEGKRKDLINFLSKELPEHNISFHKFGGLMGNRDVNNPDNWIPLEEYAEIINQSRICICSQTDPHREQIKGKIFHFMACGSLCLSDYTKDVAALVPEEAIVFYKSHEECLSKIKELIGDKALLNKISTDGYNWFHNHYDYKSFWKNTLLDISQKQSLKNQENREHIELFKKKYARHDRYKNKIIVHKRRKFTKPPKVSLILLDWSVREHFQALYWMQKQDVKREDYELIWVEVHDKVADYAMEHADTVITCGYPGRYHKHVAYNTGVLEAQGDLVCVLDSDAVFPENFISSILDNFETGDREYKPLVLMHYEARTNIEYPGNENIKSIDEVKSYPWKELWENVGACMTVRRADAINFGGFDEHKSLRGFYCGPYDLGWRMINAGIPEIWEKPEKCVIWHFAHPAPHSSANNIPDKKNKKNDYYNLHLAGHALVSVESFSSGRLLPLKENKYIHKMRMKGRRIGSELEKEYSELCSASGFSKKRKIIIYFLNKIEMFGHKMSVYFDLPNRFPKLINFYRRCRRAAVNNNFIK